MNYGITGYGPGAWSEAQQRAETYLNALHGGLGSAQRELLVRAMQSAREQEENVATHPVTLVMQALFAALSKETTAIIAMAPPIQRVAMLPEKVEFPFHEGLGRLFRTQLLPFAGAN
ncbi:MAG TPA: hypothetical protein VGI60_07130 [Chthoniobacterales bacterium]|jgi:hypothetical protein